MFKRNSALFTALLLIISVFTGCSSGINVGNLFSDDEKTETVYSVGIAIETMDTLNPAVSKGEDCYQISKLIYSGLFRLNEQLIPQPDLASSYSYDSSHSM